MTDKEIFGLAAEHYNAVKGGVLDVGRWAHWAWVMRDKIGTFDTVREALNYAQEDLPFNHREKADNKLLDDCKTIIGEEYIWFRDRMEEISDDLASREGTLSGGVSNMTLWHLWAMLAIQSYAPSVRTVMDIGGGFGAFARLWRLYFPLDRYVIVDIPESLYFADVCLRANFGDEVGYFVSEDPKTKIVLLPVDRMAEYKGGCDIVVSIGSLQEMNETWVNFYMDWLDKCGAKFFYSLNYVAQPVDFLGESRCLWATRPGMAWRTKLLSFDPVVIRIMCPARRFLEALYSKEGATDSLKSWSVLRGRVVNFETYVEGLDLLRQQPTVEYIELFLRTMLTQCERNFIVPKEVLALGYILKTKLGKNIVNWLEPMDKEFAT